MIKFYTLTYKDSKMVGIRIPYFSRVDHSRSSMASFFFRLTWFFGPACTYYFFLTRECIEYVSLNTNPLIFVFFKFFGVYFLKR